METFLRFTGGIKRDPDIDNWLDTHPGPLGDLARVWFARMRRSGEDVLELLHDGCPVACVGDIPFAYVNVFKAHMNVGFYQGASLDDPAGLLTGTGKRMRHVKLSLEKEIDETALDALLGQAYRVAHTLLGGGSGSVI
jgi:hypothetical protein